MGITLINFDEFTSRIGIAFISFNEFTALKGDSARDEILYVHDQQECSADALLL